MRLTTGLTLFAYLATHLLNHALGLWSLEAMEAGRQQLRMSLGETLQVLMGLSIPLLLATHVVGTRLAHTWFEVEDSYT